MKISPRKFWEKLKNPPLYVKILTAIITLLFSIASIIIAIKGQGKGIYSIFSYVGFAIAGISLTYSVFLIIPTIPKAKKRIISWMEKHDFTYLLLRNFGFRAVIFSIGSFILSIAFGVFNGYMGIKNKSIWYGALSAYYIALVFLRGGILVYHKNKIGKVELNDKEDLINKEKTYRNCGIILMFLNISLSTAIGQMIFNEAYFIYMGWTIFAFAAYAFYKITTSIISFIKARNHNDATIKAIKNVNLADALVSILALQTALLNTFSDGKINVSLMNTITGSMISVFTIGLGIFMIILASKRIKKIKEGTYDN